MNESEQLISVLDICGVWAFSVSGSLTALQRRMDFLGVLIVAFVTSFGGGTLRDIIINRPVFWLNNLTYLYILFGSCILAIIFRNYLNYLRKTLLLFDTIGLAVYSVLGFSIGVGYGYHPVICITLGLLTASFGGVIRDILCNEVPLIFHKEIYASISIAGGIVYTLMLRLNIPLLITTVATILLIISLRLVVIRFHLSFPQLSIKDNEAPNG